MNLSSKVIESKGSPLPTPIPGASNYFSSYLYVVETESFTPLLYPSNTTNVSNPSESDAQTTSDSVRETPPLYGLADVTPITITEKKPKLFNKKKHYRKRKTDSIIFLIILILSPAEAWSKEEDNALLAIIRSHGACNCGCNVLRY